MGAGQLMGLVLRLKAGARLRSAASVVLLDSTVKDDV